jgi:hypothetical protein
MGLYFQILDILLCKKDLFLLIHMNNLQNHLHINYHHYEIDLDYFNETARKDLKNQLIWIITRQAFTLMVSKSAE